MTPETEAGQRLRFLVRVIARECNHLQTTDERLYVQPFTAERAAALQANPDEAERVEAFVSRFGRLQDTLGDKLLPAYLIAEGERPGTALDRLDRAEALAILPSADDWLAMRKLRNQMVHEYIEDPNILANALNSGHAFVPTLLAVAQALTDAISRRGWLE
jgi:hypothetical protein